MAENFQNFYVTKLREACDSVATTIYVETVPSITEGTLVLEYANSTKHEIIHFTGVSGYGLTGCTRGLEGTTAQSHSAGTDVRQNLTAGMIDKIINGVITTENIANSAVTTAKINNGAVTADKIDFTTLSKVSCLKTGNINGTYSITARGFIYAVAEFQCEGTGDGRMKINASGMSGSVYQLEGFQYTNWVKGQAHSLILVDKNDSVTISKSTSGTGFDANRGLMFFVPCNW